MNNFIVHIFINKLQQYRRHLHSIKQFEIKHVRYILICRRYFYEYSIICSEIKRNK